MNFDDAKKRAKEVAKRHNWSCDFKRIDTLPDGSWVFWNVDPVAPWENEREAIVVSREDDRQAIALYGAIGMVFFSPGQPRALGLPKSTEWWIGSGPGRYQLFDKGIVVWDAITRRAHPRITYSPDYEKGKPCFGYVVFFDLRKFTKWAETNQDLIQVTLENLEKVIQNALYEDLKLINRDTGFVFLKGVGDGVMVILEENQVINPAQMLLCICARIIKKAREHLPEKLSIGCGVDSGQITRVFIFGQWDYLGNSVNRASKLQGKAVDTIRVSTEFQEKLKIENSSLAEKGIQLPEDEDTGIMAIQYTPAHIEPFEPLY